MLVSNKYKDILPIFDNQTLKKTFSVPISTCEMNSSPAKFFAGNIGRLPESYTK